MKITKFGHCCLLIEHKGLRILTDPGSYSTAQNVATDIHLILITHEHPDHFHLDSLKEVLKNNPDTKVITNSAVAKILAQENVPHEITDHGESRLVDNVFIEAFGKEHAEIYPSFPTVMNTGYFIDNMLFYPGDALYNPGKKVEFLALPVSGPWLKIKESIDYAKEIRPKKCFPVHDGMLKFPGPNHFIPKEILNPAGIEFIPLEEGGILEL